MTDIYKLELHETQVLHNGSNDRLTVTRVPGGWIYSTAIIFQGEKEMTGSQSSVFVPKDDEFEKKSTRVRVF